MFPCLLWICASSLPPFSIKQKDRGKDQMILATPSKLEIHECGTDCQKTNALRIAKSKYDRKKAQPKHNPFKLSLDEF